MIQKPLYHLLGAFILLIAAVVGYSMWYNTVGAESMHVSDLNQQIQIKSEDSTQVAQAKSELAALTTDESTIEQYFVSTSSVVPFLEQLQTTGKYLGSSVQVVSVSATPGKPYGHLSLSLAITGSFDAVLRTIGAIEYGPYDTSINSLTFDAASNSSVASSSQQWTADAVFSIGTQVGAPTIAPKTAGASAVPDAPSAPTQSPASTSTTSISAS